MTSETEKCGNCRFFLEETSEAENFAMAGGMCRRYAPHGPAIASIDSSWQIFPPMVENQWCGDYRPRNASVDTITRVAA